MLWLKGLSPSGSLPRLLNTLVSLSGAYLPFLMDPASQPQGQVGCHLAPGSPTTEGQLGSLDFSHKNWNLNAGR